MPRNNKGHIFIKKSDNPTTIDQPLEKPCLASTTYGFSKTSGVS
jgi:hypothetical protein